MYNSVVIVFHIGANFDILRKGLWCFLQPKFSNSDYYKLELGI